MSAEELLNAIKSGDSENIQQSLSNTMAEKISAVLDDRREELGKTMFNREETDPVNKKSAKKDFDDRKDKDIDNDGDVDDSDEYLHKRRKAIAKEKED